jgi:RimJ/RimL family protein N-acetyltransferase
VLLETRRLVLRPISLEDSDEFVALHADPEVTRCVSSFDRPRAEERLRKNDEEWRQRGHGLLAVLDRKSGEFLGRAASDRDDQRREPALDPGRRTPRVRAGAQRHALRGPGGRLRDPAHLRLDAAGR